MCAQAAASHAIVVGPSSWFGLVLVSWPWFVLVVWFWSVAPGGWVDPGCYCGLVLVSWSWWVGPGGLVLVGCSGPTGLVLVSWSWQVGPRVGLTWWVGPSWCVGSPGWSWWIGPGAKGWSWLALLAGPSG